MGVKKEVQIMKRTSDTSGTGIKSGQVDTTPRGSSSVSIIKKLLVLGASFLVLGALTIGLLYVATGEYRLFAYLSGMLATAVFIWLSVLLALRFRTSPTSLKVLKALVFTLQHDPNPGVRSKAAVGLAELELEKSFDHHEHGKLDDILISTLQHDPDPGVRSKAAVGLAELELEQEQPSYHHEHDKLDDMLFEQK